MYYKLDVVNKHNKLGYEVVNRDTFWRDAKPTKDQREELINTVIKERISRGLENNQKMSIDEVNSTKTVVISSTSVITQDGIVKPIFSRKTASNYIEYEDGTYMYDEATSHLIDEKYVDPKALDNKDEEENEQGE